MSTLLHLENLLDGVALSVAPGEAVALLGANGAGKSALLKAVLGLAPTSGRIALAGTDLTDLSVERRVRLGIGYVPEGRRVFPGMSVRDNLEVASFAPPAHRRALLERVFALFPQLRDKAAERAWRLSGGQQQMLAIGRALMGEPRLLLLDEPSLGLSPKLSGEMFAAVRAIAASGTAVLVAEQSAARALAVGSRVALLRLGRLLHDGPADTLPPDLLRAAFLGVSGGDPLAAGGAGG